MTMTMLGSYSAGVLGSGRLARMKVTPSSNDSV
jgi:hypothetical protein